MSVLFIITQAISVTLLGGVVGYCVYLHRQLKEQDQVMRMMVEEIMDQRIQAVTSAILDQSDDDDLLH